eukprot:s347_g29.t1
MSAKGAGSWWTSVQRPSAPWVFTSPKWGRSSASRSCHRTRGIGARLISLKRSWKCTRLRVRDGHGIVGVLSKQTRPAKHHVSWKAQR